MIQLPEISRPHALAHYFIESRVSALGCLQFTNRYSRMRNAECGMRNSEFGVRSSEYSERQKAEGRRQKVGLEVFPNQGSSDLPGSSLTATGHKHTGWVVLSEITTVLTGLRIAIVGALPQCQFSKLQFQNAGSPAPLCLAITFKIYRSVAENWDSRAAQRYSMPRLAAA